MGTSENETKLIKSFLNESWIVRNFVTKRVNIIDAIFFCKVVSDFVFFRFSFHFSFFHSLKELFARSKQ